MKRILCVKPMLDKQTKESLERSLECILRTPSRLNQELFVAAHNAVYTFCTLPTDTYRINGELIFVFLEDRINSFTKSLRFEGRTSGMAGQLASLGRSADLLKKVYSYLGRYYIRTGILNKITVKTGERRSVPVEPLDVLFFKKVYFNFIFNIKENLESLILIELDGYRSSFTQNCGDLGSLVRGYTRILVHAGQDEALKRFQKTYLKKFVEMTDFKGTEIGKLLKKIYLEMFYASNVIGEKRICRHLVAQLDERIEEILFYTLDRLRNDESARHVFRIVSVMDECIQDIFEEEYQCIISEKLKEGSDFSKLYAIYKKIRKQIEVNKMSKGEVVVDKEVTERLKAIGSIQRIVTECVVCIDDHVKSGRPVPDILLDFAVLLEIDSFVEHYTAASQRRLLRGGNWSDEYSLYERLCVKLGSGALSQLLNSVDTYRNVAATLTGVDIKGFECARISLYKHTAGFWKLSPDSLSLPYPLSQIVELVIKNTPLKYRERITPCMRASPVVIKINGASYKMNSDVFSIFYRIYTFPAAATPLQSLRDVSNDPNFQKNIEILVRANLIALEGDFVSILSPMHPSDSFIDLFTYDEPTESSQDSCAFTIPLSSSSATFILQAAICRVLKKEKSVSFEELCRRLDAEPAAVEAAVEKLGERGFVSVDGFNVTYVP